MVLSMTFSRAYLTIGGLTSPTIGLMLPIKKGLMLPVKKKKSSGAF